VDTGIGYPDDGRRSGLWLRLALGVLTIGVAVAALAWPAVTVRVVGILFGVNLLITGLVRAGLSLVLTAYPVPYRVIAVVFGVLTAALGVLCLRHVGASAVLLVLVVGTGWLLDGVTELALGLAAGRDPLQGWRLGIGVAAVLASVAVLVWPVLTLDAFVGIAAVFFVVIGSAEIAVALAALRRHAGAPVDDGA